MAAVAILDIGSLATFDLCGIHRCVRSFITSFVQSRQYVLPKYAMTAINLIELGHVLVDFRSDKQRFILI